MLSPVQAMNNVNLANASHGKAVIAAENLAQLASTQNPASALDNQAASEIKGKIGILLIAARERMIDSLFAVIDAAGKATVVTPLPGESRVNYAARVADKIGSLSTQNLAIAEREWSDQSPAISLKVIATALKNPAGPEAAAVIAYIETARYKDRDLATRAVMRSYRQNDGSPFRAATVDRDIAVPADAAEASSGAEEQPSRSPSSSLSQPQVSVPRAATAPSALQTPAATAARNSDEAIVAVVEDGLPLIVGEDERPASSVSSKAIFVANDAAVVQPEAEPVFPESWTNVISAITTETAELLLATIGEEEVQVFLGDAIGEPETELQAAITERIDDLVEDAVAKKAAPATTVQRPTAASTAEVSASPAQPNAAREVKLAPFPQAQTIAGDPQLQAAAMPKTAQGVGLPSVPYDFDRDAPDSGDPTLGYRTYDIDADGGGQPRGQHQQHRGGDGSQDEPPQADETAEQTQSDRLSVQPAPDPAFSLYRHMAGW